MPRLLSIFLAISPTLLRNIHFHELIQYLHKYTICKPNANFKRLANIIHYVFVRNHDATDFLVLLVDPLLLFAKVNIKDY